MKVQGAARARSRQGGPAFRVRFVVLATGVLIASASPGPSLGAGQSRKPPADKAPGVALPGPLPQDNPAIVPTVPPDDGASFRSAPARAIVLECGRVWAARKRKGNATGTWKEFFARGCPPER